MGETGTHTGGPADDGDAALPDVPVGPEGSMEAGSMADVMAGMPGVWRRLLLAHVPDRLGRCRGCRSNTGSGELWPCSLHRIATEARQLHEQKLMRAIDSD